MTPLRLLIALFVSGCATQGAVPPSSPDIALSYHDLALGTRAGRTMLVERIDRAARDFCAAYDPQDESAILDPRLASARLCPGRATLLLLNKAPASVRRAYRAGVRRR